MARDSHWDVQNISARFRSATRARQGDVRCVSCGAACLTGGARREIEVSSVLALGQAWTLSLALSAKAEPVLAGTASRGLDLGDGSQGTDGSMYVAKLNPDGSTRWATYLPGAPDFAPSVARGACDGVLVRAVPRHFRQRSGTPARRSRRPHSVLGTGAHDVRPLAFPGRDALTALALAVTRTAPSGSRRWCSRHRPRTSLRRSG